MNIITEENIRNKINNTYVNNILITDLINSIVIDDNNNVIFIINYHNQLVYSQIKYKIMDLLSTIQDIGVINVIMKDNHTNHVKKHRLSNVNKIILVTSSKGGVGKSTISVLIAESLSKSGYNVGILDADLYCSSIPVFFGINNFSIKIDKKIITPVTARNIQIVSINFLLQDKAVNLRGAISSKIINKLLLNTYWNNLDYLIIDMPPGTSDIYLSLLSSYIINGSVVVTTPHLLSKINAKKTIEQHNKFKVPILSIIENMSYMEFCNNSVELLDCYNDLASCKKYNKPFFYQLPFIKEVQHFSNIGKPFVQFIDFPVLKIISTT